MAYASKRQDYGRDWDAVASRHRRVMPVNRRVSERWMLTLFGAVLLGLIALLGWGGYSLAVVKAELRQLRAMVEHRASGYPHEEASAQRPPEPDEPTASPRLPRAGVNQGMSRGDVAREQPAATSPTIAGRSGWRHGSAHRCAYPIRRPAQGCRVHHHTVYAARLRVSEGRHPRGARTAADPGPLFPPCRCAGSRLRGGTPHAGPSSAGRQPLHPWV
jgi:hypothetical protein